MERVLLALSAYSDVMRIFYYYWNDVHDCKQKRQSFIRSKTNALIMHDHILLSEIKNG